MKRLFLSLWLISLLSLPALAGEGGFPIPYKKSDKCPVCNMFVARYPDWVAGIVFKDRTYRVFDGPKDMFHYYFHMEEYDPGRKREDIEEMVVKEYYNLKPIDARKAFYVVGSDVFGPMGRELVPFDSLDAAEEFMRDHRGKKILKFEEVTDELIQRLRKGQTMMPW